MGDLSTAGATSGSGPRSRCACGAWFDRHGDELPGIWLWHDERIAEPATTCKPCARARAATRPLVAAETYAAHTSTPVDLPALRAARSASRAPSPPDDVPPPPVGPGRQIASDRVTRRRRSDVR